MEFLLQNNLNTCVFKFDYLNILIVENKLGLK